MIAKDIKIGDKVVCFGASGDTPRQYRMMFGEDLFTQMTAMSNEKPDMTVVEQMAYVMAKKVNPDIPNIDEWLDEFDLMDIYEAAPELIRLWSKNNKTSSKSKKK